MYECHIDFRATCTHTLPTRLVIHPMHLRHPVNKPTSSFYTGSWLIYRVTTKFSGENTMKLLRLSPSNLEFLKSQHCN